MAALEVTRPVGRYMGGKWRLGPTIIAQLPRHRIYVEPFGGVASVLMLKPRVDVEVYNDLSGELVSLFRVLRNRRTAAQLRRALALTPYSREEFEASYELADDRVEQARRSLIRLWMAHGGAGLRRHRTGFRVASKLNRTAPAGDWRAFPDALVAVTERLQGVEIERRPASRIMRDRDCADALFFVDPPYPFGTRSQKRVRGDLYHAYSHELTDGEHVELLDQLVGLHGMVALSTYPNDLYDERLAGWRRLKFEARADGGEERTEVLFLNPAAAARLDRERLPLLAEAA